MKGCVARWIPYWFLSPRGLLARAAHLAARGQPLDAGRDVHRLFGRLDRLPGLLSDEELARAWSIQSAALAAAGRIEDSDAALLRAHGIASLDDEALSGLTARLLARGEGGPVHRRLYLDWVGRHCGNDGDPATWTALRGLVPRRINSRGARARLEEWCRALIERNPNVTWAYTDLGRVALSEKQWEKAKSTFETAHRLSPGDANIGYLLGFACCRCEDWCGAIHVLTPLVERRSVPRLHRLMAHAYRGLRESSQALHHIRKAIGDQACASAEDAQIAIESAINCGCTELGDWWEHAVRALPPAVRHLVQAIEDDHRGESGPALAGYVQALSVPALAEPASARLIRLVAKYPALPGALHALDEIPEPLRTDAYYRVRGESALATGEAEQALAAFGAISRPDAQLREHKAQLSAQYLAEQYNRGDYKALIETAGRPDLIPDDAADRVAPIIAAALVANARLSILGDPHQAIDSAEALLGKRPGLTRAINLAPVHAVCSLRQAQYPDALAYLDSARPLGDSPYLHLLRCAALLGAGRVAEVRRLLDGGSAGDPELDRLGFAAAAMDGDWSRAAHYTATMTQLPGEAPLVGLAMSMVDETTSALDDDGSLALYRSVFYCSKGQFSLARKCLRRIPDNAPTAAARDRLLMWIRIQAAVSGRIASEDRAGLWPGLLDWPAALDVLVDQGRAQPQLVAALARTDRRRLAALLAAGEERAGLANPQASHRLAVFHLCEGSRLLASNHFARGLEDWERSAAYLAVVLAHPSYLRDWTADRLALYGTERDAHTPDLNGAIAAKWISVFESYRDRARSEGRDEDASALDVLALSLRAEVSAARLLGKAGGIHLPEHQIDPVCAGPTYLSLKGLVGAFAEHMDGMRKAEEAEKSELSFLERLLEAMSSADGGPDSAKPDRVTELERAYSSMRIAAVLASDGNLHAALERLRAPHPWCFPLFQRRLCGAPIGRGCSATDPRFAHCSPAFGGAAGPAGLARAVSAMEADLLFGLGLRGIAADPPDAALWKESLELPLDAAAKTKLRERIRDAALGRAKTLGANGRYDTAVAVLESARELTSDQSLHAALARLYVSAGVRLANEHHDLAGALVQLRRASELHGDSPRVRTNLVLALKGCAGAKIAQGEAEEARALLREASENARHLLLQDPDNEGLQNIVREVHLELSLVEAQQAKDPEAMLRGLAAALGGGAQHLSTMHHNRGIEEGARGHFDAAVSELKEALALEPDSEVTRRALAQILNARAVQRANAQRYDEALADLDDAIRIYPEFEPLEVNRESIRRAQALHAMHKLLSGLGGR